MTDKDIIKALECCTKKYGCRDCPLTYDDRCLTRINKEASSLTKRQQAEIERLKMERQALDDALYPLPFKTDFDIAIETAKVEAYKEFAERLEYEVLHEDIEVNALKCKDYESFYNGANQFRYQAKECFSRILKELTEGSNGIE